MGGIISNILAKPESRDIKQGVYVVPAGKYAVATVMEFGAAFTADGDVVIPQLVYDTSFAANAVPATIFRNQTGYELEVSFDALSISGTVEFGVFGPDQNGLSGINTAVYDELGTRAFYNIVSTSECTPRAPLWDDCFIQHTVQAGGGTVHYKAYPKQLPPITQFVYPAGVSLNGDRYEIALYPA